MDNKRYSTRVREHATSQALYLTGERRSGLDRRVSEVAAKFPLIDSNGIYVVKDRRRIPDRRLNDIVVEWVTDVERLTV